MITCKSNHKVIDYMHFLSNLPVIVHIQYILTVVVIDYMHDVISGENISYIITQLNLLQHKISFKAHSIQFFRSSCFSLISPKIEPF